MRGLLGCWLLLLVALTPLSAAAQASYLHFESGPVRPLAQSPDGKRLFATNISDNRLEIFSVGDAGLTHEAAVSVGLEPVAVAARTNTEVWVVNHLSDSVSIVDLAETPPRPLKLRCGRHLRCTWSGVMTSPARSHQRLPERSWKRSRKRCCVRKQKSQ